MEQWIYNLQTVWDWLWKWWSSFGAGFRDNYLADLAVVATLAVLGFFWKTIGAFFHRLLSRTLPPSLPTVEPQKVVIEVKPPPVAVDTPPAHVRTPVPVRLPSTAVDFVTRRDKDGRDLLEVLKEELSPQRNQVVTLCGPGGVGKTALAAEAFRLLMPQFPQRVWISADGRPDFSLSTLLDAIATQLGQEDLRRLNEQAKAEEVQRLVATTPTLLALDNFETVSPAEKIRCAEWLMQFAPCPALITSRNPVERARSLSIHAMSPPEAQELLTRLINNAPQPRVFASVDRDQLIRVAEGNPLVLEWIVAQMRRAQTASTVLAELTQGNGEIAQRVFERSFNLPEVGDDGRATVLALSLFVPDASHEALSAVAGFGDDVRRVNDALKPLADLRLIETTEDNQRLLVQGLTRELAKAQLATESHAHDFRQRFAGYFVEYGQTYGQPTPENLDALEIEKDNLLQAQEVAVALQEWEKVTAIADGVMFDGINGLLPLRGYWEEAIRTGIRALDAARQLGDQTAIGRFTYRTAIMHQQRGELTEAQGLYEESLRIAKQLGDQSGIASTLHALGVLEQNQGELAEAKGLYEESLGINKQLGDQGGIAITLHQLGRLAQGQGELAEAKELYEESLRIKKQLGNQSGIASTLHQLGVLAQGQGELAEAKELYGESLRIKKQLGNQSGIASTLHQLGRLAQGQGELTEAQGLYEESLRIKKQLGDQGGIAITLHQLGALEEEAGNKTAAGNLFLQSLEIFEKLKSPNAKIARRSLARVEGEGE
ncbi:MAG: tetratricopeptide repeat protein [Deltaproteobacteria bacterium]|nr:tetratricopeptide repeat protein [Deltaproteobacteria bacterium]